MALVLYVEEWLWLYPLLLWLVAGDEGPAPVLVLLKGRSESVVEDEAVESSNRDDGPEGKC